MTPEQQKAIAAIKDQIVLLPSRERQHAVETFDKLQRLITIEDNAALLAFSLFGLEVEVACNECTRKKILASSQH